MADTWRIRGGVLGICIGASGSPCQFNAVPPAPTGTGRPWMGGRIGEGHFKVMRLDGSRLWLLQWPGEILQGNGTSR